MSGVFLCFAWYAHTHTHRLTTLHRSQMALLPFLHSCFCLVWPLTAVIMQSECGGKLNEIYLLRKAIQNPEETTNHYHYNSTTALYRKRQPGPIDSRFYAQLLLNLTQTQTQTQPLHFRYGGRGTGTASRTDVCRAHCTRAPLTVYARTARAVHAQRIRVHVAPARYIYARTVRTHRAPTAHRTHLQKWWYFF